MVVSVSSAWSVGGHTSESGACWRARWVGAGARVMQRGMCCGGVVWMLLGCRSDVVELVV